MSSMIHKSDRTAVHLKHSDDAVRPIPAKAESSSADFLTPTLVSVGIEIGTVIFLVSLLLLIAIKPGDAGFDGGGSGDGLSGIGGIGESVATGSGHGDSSAATESETGNSAAAQADASNQKSAGNAALQASANRPKSSGIPLTPPRQKDNVFVVQDLPQPVANAAPRGAGGGDGFSDLGDRLQKAGAKTGDVQISLAWNNGNDLDLYVETPGHEKIWYNNRNSTCGGELDVDMNAGGPASQRPVENVYWQVGASPSGKFRVSVHYYANHGGRDPTQFQVTIKVKDRSQNYTGSLRPGDPMKLVHEFTFP